MNKRIENILSLDHQGNLDRQAGKLGHTRARGQSGESEEEIEKSECQHERGKCEARKSPGHG